MRYLLLVLLLAGCSSLEQIAQEPAVQQDDPRQDAKKIAAAKRICVKKYGYLPGSSTYERCMEENAPGLKAEIEKTIKKDDTTADAKLMCVQKGYPENSEEFYACVSNALDNAAASSVKKQRR